MGDGINTNRYATRFYFDEELLVEEAGDFDFRDDFYYSNFTLVTSLDKVSFVGVLEVLPKLLTELEKHTTKRNKEIEKAQTLMAV